MDLPHNEQLERQVIGSAIVDRCIPYDAKALTVTDFYYPFHQKLWSKVCEFDMENQQIDLIELAGHVEKPITELADISRGIPVHLDTGRMVKEIKRLSTLRTLQKGFYEIANHAGTSDVSELVERAEGLLKAVQIERDKQGGTSVALKDVFEQDVFPRLDKFVSGEAVRIPFGWSRLDGITNGGCSPGDLVIFGAKPKAGKSALVLQFARMQANAGFPVYYCSREMANYENGFRYLAQSTEYTINQFRPGLFQSVADKIKQYATNGGDVPLYLDAKAKTVVDIKKELQRHENEGLFIPCVYVDYVQLMRGSGKWDTQAAMYEQIIYDLKELAHDTERVVYCNAQFNRDGIDSDRPKMSDFKGSSAIEMAGNLIIFWTLEQEMNLTYGARSGQMWIEAGRNVPFDEFSILFRGEKSLFEIL